MATKQERIQIVLEALGVNETMKQFKRMQVGLKNFDKDIKNNLPDGVGKEAFMEAGKAAGVLNSEVKALRGPMLGFGLSIMFAGMALKRLTDSALKSLMKAYSDVTENQTAIGKQAMGLNAAFTFLKFTLIEAFNSDVFVGFMDFIISITNNIAKFVAAHPGVARFIVTFLAMLSVIGGLAMVLGQISLLATGLGVAFGPVIGIILIVAVALSAITSIWLDDGPVWLKVIKSVAIGLAAIVAIMVVLGKGQLVIKALGVAFTWLAAHPVVALILALVAVITLLFKAQERVGGWSNLFVNAIENVHLALITLQDTVQTLMHAFQMLGLKTRLSFAVAAGDTDAVAKIKKQIKKAASEFEEMQSELDDKREAAYAKYEALKVEPEGGFDYIHENKELTDAVALEETKFDHLNEETSTQTSVMENQLNVLENISGGASLSDLKDMQDQTNVLLSELSANERAASITNRNVETNVTITAQEVGADVLDENRLRTILEDVLDEMLLKDNGTTTT